MSGFKRFLKRYSKDKRQAEEIKRKDKQLQGLFQLIQAASQQMQQLNDLLSLTMPSRVVLRQLQANKDFSEFFAENFRLFPVDGDDGESKPLVVHVNDLTPEDLAAADAGEDIDIEKYVVGNPVFNPPVNEDDTNEEKPPTAATANP